MAKSVIDKIREELVEKYPDKFSSVEDLPYRNMIDILKKKGIAKEEIKKVYAIIRFNHTLERSGVRLEGMVLDLCSGNISIASVYDQEKVVCYDFMTDIVKHLRGKGVKVVQANIRDKAFPFKDKSFDYLFCEGFPLAPCKSKDVYESAEMIVESKFYVRKVVEEMIRVTRNKAVICSYPLVRYFPRRYEKRIEKLNMDYYLIVLNCQNFASETF